MIVAVALIFGGLVLLELIALVGRRSWVHWKLGRRRPLADEAVTALANALVLGTAPARPQGRVRRRAFRLAALEVFPALAGNSRERLARLVDDLGLVDDVMRTLRRSPRAYARRTAAAELGEMRSPRSAPALVAGLADRDPIVRVACVRGLAWLSELSQIERMLRVLDRDAATAPSEASSAMLALAAAAPESLVELEDSGQSPFARRLAALALARAGDARAMPSLLGELATDNALLASVAVRAIERVGGTAAISSLEHVLTSVGRDAVLREQAERALERVQAAGGVR
jgi:HEAT repeat protein